jgi:hypothetical protein
MPVYGLARASGVAGAAMDPAVADLSAETPSLG